MREFKVGKALSFDEMMKEVEARGKEARKKFESNGGVCLNCGNHPGMGFEGSQALNPFNCEACNAKTAKILGELKGRPGFSQIRVRK